MNVNIKDIIEIIIGFISGYSLNLFINYTKNKVKAKVKNSENVNIAGGDINGQS